MSWAHLPIVPVALPLAAGALLLLLGDRRQALKAALSAIALILLLMAAMALVVVADASAPRVYALGNWPAPFGIVLVVDRLAAVMVLLATVLAMASLAFAHARWDRAAGRFHALVQFLVMGLNGAFLTGDLFNLFVFFELLLAASYGLALHGSGTARVRAGLHYIVVNLAASLLFLIGVSLIYGVTGTLNMAQIAQRIPEVAAGDRVLVESGAAILALAFLVKAAMWPLGFWLPAAYEAASAPAAALFAILSKVGIYAVLRLWLLFFAAGTGSSLLFFGGIATVMFGMAGMLAAQRLGGMAGYCLVVSSGTLLAAISRDDPSVTSAALFYLVASSLGVAAFFLLSELVQRTRAPGAEVLAVTAEAFGIEEDEPAEQPGPAIPATMAVLGLAFIACALLIAGLPPLPGFVAKLSLLAAILAPQPVAWPAWTLLALLTISGLATLVAMMRAGMGIFWAAEPRSPPRVLLVEMAPIAALLLVCVTLTISAGPAMAYFQAAAAALHAPRAYIDSVLIHR
jgi:multicomponent K+:H+ antiporter subunit D